MIRQNRSHSHLIGNSHVSGTSATAQPMPVTSSLSQSPSRQSVSSMPSVAHVSSHFVYDFSHERSESQSLLNENGNSMHIRGPLPIQSESSYWAFDYFMGKPRPPLRLRSQSYVPATRPQKEGEAVLLLQSPRPVRATLIKTLLLRATPLLNFLDDDPMLGTWRLSLHVQE